MGGRHAWTTVSLSLLCLSCGSGQSASPAELGVRMLPITFGDAVPDGAEQSVGVLGTYASFKYNGQIIPPQLAALCTATLISPTAVLTAEHCVNQELLKESFMDPSSGIPAGVTLNGDFTFKFSFTRSANPNAGGDLTDTHDPSSVDESPNFAPSFGNGPAEWGDIAIVHLAQPITDHPIQKIATTEMVQAMAADAEHLASGYGLTSDSDQMSSGVLTAGKAHIAQLGDHEIATDPSDHQQACHGDSGGPLFLDGTDSYQIGITSRADNASQANPNSCSTGTVYTRVDAYLDWIKQKVPDLGQTGGTVGDGDTTGGGDGDLQSGDGDTGGNGDGDNHNGGDGDNGDGNNNNGGDGGTGSTGGGKKDSGCSVSTGASNTTLLPLFSLLGLGLVIRRRRSR